MAGEAQVTGGTGWNCYALIRNGAGQAWRPASGAFENYSAANYANYATAVALTEQGGSGYFIGNFPAGVTAPGKYNLEARRRMGASPAESDPTIGGGAIEWDGYAEVAPGRDPWLISTVQASPSPSVTQFGGGSALATSDGAYLGFVAFLSGANAGQARRILGYLGATRWLIAEAFPVAPAAGDVFLLAG